MTFEVLKSVLPLFLRVWWTVTLTLYTDKWWWRFSLFGQKSWNAILKYVSLKVWMLTKFWNKPSNFKQRFAKKKKIRMHFFFKLIFCILVITLIFYRTINSLWNNAKKSFWGLWFRTLQRTRKRLSTSSYLINTYVVKRTMIWCMNVSTLTEFTEKMCLEAQYC